MAEQDFIKAGFTVVGTENNENKLLSFLKENYPSVIKDREIDLNELKAIAGLPIDEKVNGYGLNFVGRNFARAKYAQKTEKELRLNTTLSKNIDTTENLVLKGDNLDSLKILKNHYSGQVKCIYIDPPYNTTREEFVYPDKFDKEEAEVLGLTNLSDSDFARMDFSFKTKKSHNGWLAFMYSRLLLARDLLSIEGAIFISIDDNEQANLKLLCDNVFGEENFITQIGVIVKTEGRQYGNFAKTHEYLLVYAKSNEYLNLNKVKSLKREFRYFDDEGGFNIIGLRNRAVRIFNSTNRPNLRYPFYVNTNQIDENGFFNVSVIPNEGWLEVLPSVVDGLESVWRWGKETANSKNNELVALKGNDNEIRIFKKDRELTTLPKTVWFEKEFNSIVGTREFNSLLGEAYFDFPKPINLIKTISQIATNDSEIILDFFAGSGTTGHAVMQLNSEDGGNRKFILCQIDEPIDKKKPAYQFCIDNNLPPVISSITIERIKRAGEKIAKDIETENSKKGLFDEDKKQVPDIGIKVFDSVEAPKLKVDEKGQISITENETDALSRIYNMIFTVGLDEPTQVPEEVVKNCIYKIDNHYYITNSEKITSDDYSNAIKNGKVFIDGWKASLNGTLQNYKEDVKIVF